MDLTLGGQPVNIVYTGETSKKVPSGEGMFTATTNGKTWNGTGTFENGVFKTGSVTECPISAPFGDITLDGSYTGNVDGGFLSGDGKFVSTSEDNVNTVYEGQWVNGIPSGDGKAENIPVTITITKHDYEGKFTGDTVNGKPEGSGKFIYDKDDVKISYDGEWKAGAMSGEGKLEDNDYGIWFSDEPDVEKKGEFKGTTVDGHPSKGDYTRTNSSGEKYTYSGQWNNDVWDGIGDWKFEDPEIFERYGNFVNGDYKPTISQYMTSYGCFESMPFDVSTDNQQFIDDNSKLFPFMNDGSSNLSDYVDSELNYKKFIKQPSAFSKKLMTSSKQRVVQIFEESDSYMPGGVCTRMITYDANNYNDVYYVFYPGSLVDIYEGSTLKLIGLPLDTSIYDNVGGGQTKCIIMLLAGIG